MFVSDDTAGPANELVSLNHQPRLDAHLPIAVIHTNLQLHRVRYVDGDEPNLATPSGILTFTSPPVQATDRSLTRIEPNLYAGGKLTVWAGQL